MKPLHVRVAEALGETVRPVPLGIGWQTARTGEISGLLLWVPVPDYDTDWSATGPLIERYEIALQEDGCGFTEAERWLARADYHADDPTDKEYGGYWTTAEARGATPLIAVCNLILALKEAGKL